MKSVNHHSNFTKKLLVSLAFVVFLISSSFAQQGDATKGKQLFNANCAACHRLDKRLVGPALKGISEKRSRKWLHSWIKDNIALRVSGDADAKAIFKEFNKIPMMQFPQLSSQDVDDIIAYTNGVPKKVSTAVATGNQPSQAIIKGKQIFNANCAACHKLDKRFVGPALRGIANKRSRKWLHSWIKDNVALRASGDADAKAIFKEFNKIPMMQFPQLSSQDIDDVIAYTSSTPKKVSSVVASGNQPSQDVIDGKKLFQANCAACHKLDKRFVGPALRNIADKKSKKWLHSWIKDNVALRASGDEDAKAIYEEFNKVPMMQFPQLSAKDIDNILAYTSYKEVKKTTATATKVEAKKKSSEASTVWMSYIVAIVLLLLILWVYLKSNNGFLKVIATIILMFGAAYITFQWLMNIGIDTGYQPVQPIEFSHKIHAGDNKIDCQYCHFAAKHSKTSGIPPLNVCMNCHKNISEYNGPVTAKHDKKFYDGEIQKLYDAIGWDKNNFRYKANYKKRPVKWVRIHNLPDFAYFNHSQHVVVAGVKCQKCHGPVQTMDRVKQYSKLTMGWCIHCHQSTDVKMKGNGYYTKIHEQLSKKYGLKSVTEAQMGGKECGRCHY